MTRPSTVAAEALPGLFTGQTTVVTGASSGVGRAIALSLATQGAIVCLLGRKVDALQSVADSMPATAPHPLIYQVDLTQDEDVDTLCAGLRRDCGQLDMLIHSAGVIIRGEVAGAAIADFDLQYRTNVRGVYLLTQALLPMLTPHCGQIVFVNSSVALRARGGLAQYAASKHALKAIADSLRDEVNRDGIRVLSVYLGRTATPMQAAVHKMEGREYHPEGLIQPEDVASVVTHALSLPRTIEVTDITVRPLTKSS